MDCLISRLQVQLGYGNDVAGCGREYDVIGQRHARRLDLLMATSGSQLGSMVAMPCLHGSDSCRHQRGHVCGPDAGEITSDHPVHLPDVIDHL